MPNENVTTEDLKATARAKAEDLKDTALNIAEDTKARVDALSTNQKVLLTGAVALVVAVVVQKVTSRRKAQPVNNVYLLQPVAQTDDLD